ncbi:MAG: hypothetical protein INR73_15460 [Williamsia sp.]|nr:hypothetical protein [Williamsia sp.]
MKPIPVYRLLVLACCWLAACSTISKFDQYSYTQSTSLKVDALNVMNQATEPYSQHQTEVAKVRLDLDKMYEYQKNRPKNEITEKMWGVLRDTSGHLFGGFVKRWQREGKLDQVFVQEARILVGESFDQISQLESGKIKSVQVTN